MKIVTILAVFILTAINLQAEGIKFFKGSWEEALTAARESDKLIFVDAYTTWCGPCKAMSQNVFPDPKVGAFYNANFINVKLDMERGEGLTFAKKYRVSAYPSLFYIDGDGKVVHHSKGAKPVPGFIKLGEFALKQFDKTVDYTKAYENGERDPDFLRKYAYGLVRFGKPHLKIANEYIKTQEDLTTETNIKALFTFMTEVDSRIYTLLMANKEQVLKYYTANELQAKVEAAAFNTVDKAIEFKVKSLIDEANVAIETYYPEMAKEFALKADMRYHLATSNSTEYMKAANKYVKKYAKKNAKELHTIVIQTMTTFEDKSVLGSIEKWADKAAQYGGDAKYYFTHAMLLKEIGNKAEAMKVASKGRKLAKEQNIPTNGFDRLIKELGA